MGEESSPVGLVGYVEVPGFQDGADYETWKEITLNTGASQSTLQDIKFPETAGGYVYKDNNVIGSTLSNRFIHWHSHDSTLELVESSLDVQLKGRLLRLQFHHSAVLSGLSIYETPQHVHILLATVSSMYRLTFPHPKKMASTKELSLGLGAGWGFSIFHEASLASLWDSQNSYMLNPTGASVPLPHAASTGLTSNGDALFVLALSTGTLQVVSMPSKGSGEKVALWEIRHMSVMSRLWSGLVPTAMWASQEGEDMAISLSVCSLPTICGTDSCVVALCKDLRIRLWNLNKRECLFAVSLTEYCKNQHSWNLSGQQPCLKLVPRTQNGVLDVAVHLCFPELSQFLIFRIEADENRAPVLRNLASMAAPEHTLVDFKFTLTDMWTLWMDVNSDPLVLYTPYNWETGKMECTSWRLLSFPLTWPQEVPLTLVDAREAFLKEIFAPGRFSASTINKAISIYCRSSADTSFRDLTQKNLIQLRDRVTMAVENEIRNRACETELTDEAYLELQHSCWEQFLSYCIQYHEVGTKVLGLLVDPETDLIGVIRKHGVSLCCPCDPLEVFLLSDVSRCSPNLFLDHAEDKNDMTFINSANYKGLWSVMKNVQKLHEYTDVENTHEFFDHGLFYLRSPEELVAEVTNELMLSAGGPLLAEFGKDLNDVAHVLDCLQFILQQLDLTKYEEDMDCFNQQSQEHLYKQSFFGSPSGVNAVYFSVLQMAKFRYYFCRDLAILESLLIYWAKKKMVNMNYDQLQQLDSKLFSQTCCFMHSYFVMYWCLQTLAVPVKQKTLETRLRELSIVEFHEHSSYTSFGKPDASPQTLVQLFIQRHGITISAQALQSSFGAEQPGPWTQMWHTYRNLLAAAIWPVSTSMTFTEFLLTSGQYLSLQEYVRLTEGWCERNSSSRLYLLANAYLSLCQPLKALGLFFKAAEGIHNEPYLMEKFMGSTSEIIASYYLEVIQLFEYFNLPDCIIRVAKEAISSCSDPNSLATLWSLIFKYHLDLDRCADAYSAMMRNPDTSRRRDCLHQFLIVLFERGHQHQIIQFPFDGLIDDVILILESKARSTDLSSNSYYEFLYAFHVKCANYRRAASNMYEYSTRLSQEVLGVKGLSRQAACLLTTLNCLHLVDPNYAWIVKPVPTLHQLDNPVSMSPKRDYDGQEIENTGKWRQIQVLEMSDIAKEYDLVHARMTLLKKSVGLSAGPLSPTDTVSLLVAEDLFSLASKLCQSYNLSLQPIFEGLASRCATEFLLNNAGMSKEEIWKMLQDYLLEHETVGHSTYHRLVSEKLLSAGLHLPTWLHKSYKARNSPELLLVYLNNDFLSEASELALEIIDDCLFQAKQIADPKNIRMWLPYTALDKLLLNLDVNSNVVSYNQMHTAVNKKINEYFEKLEFWALSS